MHTAVTALVAAATILVTLVPAVRAELTERGDLFVHFQGGIDPVTLPRKQLAPITVTVAGTVKTLSGERPPALRKVQIELNKGGELDSSGLPVCSYGQLVAVVPARALEVCGDALVGDGVYLGKSSFPEQATFPSQGHILAFNGVYRGREVILAHVYGTDPVPTSYTLTFALAPAKGTFGTVLRASLPEVTGSSGYITGISLNLGRSFRSHGKTHSYLSASCPAPKGFPGAVFPFARASFGFAGKTTVTSTLTRSCGVRG